MKTVLKIEIDDNGISRAECNISNDDEMNEEQKFKTSVMLAASATLRHPFTVKDLSELSKMSAQAKMFGGEQNKTKS
ncbi:MAG: hypothetical protein IKR72_02975 [Bacteroidales bacterium]|nr:hypothetical protein [Bacteroidales bacterium]